MAGSGCQTPAVQAIDDPADPRLDDYRHLSDRAARAAVELGTSDGVFIVEGPVALEQLLASTHRVRSILVTPSRARSLRPLLDAAPSPVLVAERDVLAEVAGYDVHRGVLAAAARPEPADARVLLDGARRVLVLEAVSDNENVGALFRNAAAFGIDAVLLDVACTDPLYRRSIRVSSGWTMRLPHARVSDAADGIDLVRRAGCRTVALTPAAAAVDLDVAAQDGLLDDPVAFVVGAEGPGLERSTMELADVQVRIPMAPGVDSLNVATSFAVVAAVAASRRRWR